MSNRLYLFMTYYKKQNALHSVRVNINFMHMFAFPYTQRITLNENTYTVVIHCCESLKSTVLNALTIDFTQLSKHFLSSSQVFKHAVPSAGKT